MPHLAATTGEYTIILQKWIFQVSKYFRFKIISPFFSLTNLEF